MREAILKTDGACKGNPGPASVGIVLLSPDGQLIDKHGEEIGHSTNNVAEYTALLKGIQLAKAHGISHINAVSDSQVLVRHANGQYNVKEPHLVRLMQMIKEEIDGLEHFQLSHVLREHNRDADDCANKVFMRNKVEEHIQNAGDSWNG